MSSALPATLRRSHRTLLAGLRTLAYELHVLHRLWYKGRAQFRHMVWWRPLQRVRRIGSAAVTGPLAGSVPLARAAAPPPQPSDALVETDGARVVGVDVLWAIADVHASLWGAEAQSCAHLEKRGTPTCAPDPVLVDAARELAHELAELLGALHAACRACLAAIEAHLRTPPAPMHAATCVALIAVIARIAACADEVRGADGPLTSVRGALAARPQSTPSATDALRDLLDTVPEGPPPKRKKSERRRK